MKKNYQQPATTVVSVESESHLLTDSLHNVTTQQGVNIRYGGGNNGGARVKDATDTYDVWDDDWQGQ